MIIELLYDPTKFRNILIKSYFTDSIYINYNQLILKSPILISIKVLIIEKSLAKVLSIEKLSIYGPIILIPLLFLASVKHGCR